MESTFKIGEIVVCVNARGSWYKLGRLRENEMYTVIGFNPFDDGLILEEIKSRWSGHNAYKADRFRKVDYDFSEKVLAAIQPQKQEKVQFKFLKFKPTVLK